MIHNTKRRDGESMWAMPDGLGSRASTAPVSRRGPAGFDPYRGGPSPEFVARGRKVDLESPTKFIPTVKAPQDIVI